MRSGRQLRPDLSIKCVRGECEFFEYQLIIGKDLIRAIINER